MNSAFLKACVWHGPVTVGSFHTECITGALGPTVGLARVAVELNIFPSKKYWGLSLGPNGSRVLLQRSRRYMKHFGTWPGICGPWKGSLDLPACFKDGKSRQGP